MEFQEVVRRRRMVRSFEARPVPAEVLERVLDNARRAPSAGFSQGYELLVLEGAEQAGRFFSLTMERQPEREQAWPSLTNAPVVIVPFAHKQTYIDRYAEPDKGWTDRDEARWPVPFWLTDTSFAAMLILLSAVNEGLGALFFGFRNKDGVSAAFGVPVGYDPIGAIALGYPAPDRPSSSLKRGRRAAAEMVHRGRW